MKSRLSIPEDLLIHLRALGLDPCDVVLYLNSECNLRCQHCYVGNALLEEANYLSTESVLGFLSQISSLGRITVLGGEPLLHRGIAPILSAIALMKIRDKRLTTNLTILPSSVQGLLAESDIRPCVSIDGHTPELHERIRGKGTFIRTIDNLKSLLSAGVDAEITHTVNSYNIPYLFDLVDFLRELGVCRLNLHSLSIKGNARENKDLGITPTMWRTLIREIEARQRVLPAEGEGLKVRYELAYVTEAEMEELASTSYRNHARGSFYAKGSRIVLYPDGKVYVSSEAFGTEAFIGNFQSGSFEYNDTPQNELLASAESSFDVTRLDPLRQGDENYPIPLSVSFRLSRII